MYLSSVHPIDGAGGIMFLGCPSVCACVHAYVWARQTYSLTSLTSSLTFMLHLSCCL